MDTQLLPAWQARQDAEIEAKFNAMVGQQPEEAPPPPPKPPEVDPAVAEGWVGEFLQTTGADIGDVLLRGVSFNLIKPSDLGALGNLIDTYKTPDDRKTALRKWAEFGMIELPVGFLSPISRAISPLGKLATRMVSGAGAVTKGAVRAGAEMGALGAAQQAGEEVRSGGTPGEGILPKAGRIAAGAAVGATIGAALGGGVAKIEQVIARRASPKAATIGTQATDDAEKAAWDKYASERPGETTATATAEMDAAEKAAWDVAAKEAEAAGKSAPPKPSGPIPAGPSSTERKPIGALSPAPEPPSAPPLLSAREIAKKADTLESMKEGMGLRGRRVLDERITELRSQAKERAAVEVAEQAATGLKDPAVRQAVQEALDTGRLFLPEGLGRDLGPAGKVNIALTSLLARASLGALTGAAIGDTPEEKMTNALALAGGAAVLSPRLFKGVVSHLTEAVKPADKMVSGMTVKQGRKLLSIRNLKGEDVERMAKVDPAEIEIPNNRALSIKYGADADPEDVQSLVKRIYSEMGETGSGAVHLTDAELWRRARLVGADKVIGREAGAPVSRVELAGATAFAASIQGEMTHLLNLARSGTGEFTPDMLRTLSVGASIFNTIQGSLNEAGATLRIGRLVAELATKGQLEDLAAIATAFGGPKALTFDGPVPASAIKDMIAQATRKNILPGWLANLNKDLMGSWINGMLSSGVSFMRNAVGTGAMFPLTVVERRMAEAGGQVAPGEAADLLWSVPETLRDAVRIAINSWEARPALTATKAAIGAGIGATQGDTWDERLMNAASLGAIGAFSQVRFPEWGATKLESTGVRKLWNPENYGVDTVSYFGKGLSLLGDLMQSPGDALRQADNLLKMVLYRGEVRALARREVWNIPGIKDDAAQFDAQLAELVNTPTKEIMEAAKGFAEKNTFTRDLGTFGTMLANTIDSNIISKIVVPFFRTTVNIAKEFLEIAPGVAQLNSANWKAMRAGGAERDLAIAKQALGVMVALPAWYLADKGYILGDMPKHQGTAAIANSLGHQPYAVKLPNGNTISFNGASPVGWFFGMAADITQMLKHADVTTEPLIIDFAKAYILALGESVAAQSYLQSIGNATQALLDEDGAKLTRYLQMQSRSLVPRLASNWAAQDDQVRYEIHSLRDAVYSQLPGYSRTVPPLRDPFGDIVYRYGAVGPDSASFLFFRPGIKDPAKQAILDNNISLAKPPRSLFGSGESSMWFPEGNQLKVGVPLDPVQYDRYVELAGQAAKDRQGRGMKDRVTAYVGSKKYANDSRAGREKEILTIAREHREMAEQQLLKEFPELEVRRRDLERARAAAAQPGANEAQILLGLGR